MFCGKQRVACSNTVLLDKVENAPLIVSGIGDRYKRGAPEGTPEKAADSMRLYTVLISDKLVHQPSLPSVSCQKLRCMLQVIAESKALMGGGNNFDAVQLNAAQF